MLLAIHSIHSLMFPSLAEHPTKDFAGVKTLKFILDTAIADGLHWAVTELPLEYTDPEARLAVSLHPVYTVNDITNLFYTSKVVGGLPLEVCEFHVGRTLLRKINGLRGPDRQTEWFPWEAPYDPVFRKEKRHNLETGRYE
jgi:hypothetical protein